MQSAFIRLTILRSTRSPIKERGIKSLFHAVKLRESVLVIYFSHIDLHSRLSVSEFEPIPMLIFVT